MFINFFHGLVFMAFSLGFHGLGLSKNFMVFSWYFHGHIFHGIFMGVDFMGISCSIHGIVLCFDSP